MLSFEEIGATGYREQQGYEIKARKREESAKIYVKIAYARMDRKSAIFWVAVCSGMKIKLTMMVLGWSRISCTGFFDSRIENTPSMGSEKVGNWNLYSSQQLSKTVDGSSGRSWCCIQNQKFKRFGHKEDDKAIPEQKWVWAMAFFGLGNISERITVEISCKEEVLQLGN